MDLLPGDEHKATLLQVPSNVLGVLWHTFDAQMESVLGNQLYCRVAVLDNCLFALGGFDSTNYQSSVERLDPRMGKWISVPR